VVDIVESFYPDEVDAAQLLAAKNRATEMLQKAATLEISPEDFGVTVRVINETGHKLPSGYPEGRRIWLNVVAYDSLGQQVFESAAYDFGTADLTHDDQAKIYEIHPGLSPGLAAALGLPAGKSFHFVLNDTVYFDNRIPPRGFTNAAFEAIQSAPVAYSYADSQYWDDTEYNLPPEADSVHAILYYQTTSKEYVVFLRDENYTNSAGQDLYNAWNAQGKSGPVVMAEAGTPVDVTYTGMGRVEAEPKYAFGMSQNYPNPFSPNTSISYSLPVEGPVKVNVYDASGRLVRTLVDETQSPGRYRIDWDGMNDDGQKVAAGIYFIRYETNGRATTKKSVMLK
jgi:hypothetical protein